MNETKRNAEVRYGGDGLFIGISPSGYAIVMDAGAERSTAISPIELLLLALGGCTGADVVTILRKKREQVTDYRMEISATRREEPPRSYQRIEVRHIIRGNNISHDAVAQAIKLSETKYCSVAATLRPTAEITSTFEVHEAASGAKA